MGQKVQGGLYCPQCQRPVMGVKNTHRIRNAASVLTLPATAGLSVIGAKVEGYICPSCGGPVVRPGRTGRQPRQQAELWLVLGIILGIVGVVDLARHHGNGAGFLGLGVVIALVAVDRIRRRSL